MVNFTVMTFNLRGSYFNEPVAHSWETRAGLCAGLIEQESPDIIGFQEFQQGNLESFQKTLSGYSFALGFPVGETNSTGKPMHNAIFWRHARFELLGTGGLYLSATPEQYSFDIDGQSRSLTWAILRERTRDQVLVHGNVHLAHNHLEARQAGADVVTRCIRGVSQGRPTVLTGDFNERPRDFTAEERERVITQFGAEKLRHNAKGDTLERFEQAGFHDAFKDVGGDDTLDSCNGFVGWPRVGHRLDWVLLQAGHAACLRATRVQIVKEAKPAEYPSDHYPVVAALEVR